MLESNTQSLDSVYYRRFTDSQLNRVHEATLEILEDIGIRFQDDEALRVFRNSGAAVEGNLVRIPSSRVEWALRAAPKQLTLYDQQGQPAIRLRGRRAYFGNGSDLPYIIDHRTGERRRAVLQDVEEIVRLLDELEHIDFVMSGFLPSDVPVDKVEPLQMQAMMQYTDKPIIYVTTDLRQAQAVIAMAEVIAGGAEPLRTRPFAACYINITNPLRHNPESVRKLMWLSEKGLPFNYRPSLVTRGISTPITGAGFLAVNNAAGLAGLVLSQLIREGTPFLRDSCAGGTFDMQHMVGQQSSPEIRGFNEDMLHHYGLPGFGIGGTAEAKVIDSQAAYEAALTLITSVQAGAHLIHDVGYLDNAATGSLVQLVVCHEMIGWIKAYMQPLPVTDETLALDQIREVVAEDGNFLASANTARHFRDDYYPELAVRRDYTGWLEEGALSIEEKASAYVQAVLDRPAKQRLSDEQAGAIGTIVDQG